MRQAVDQAFQSQIPRERIGELLDELGHTAGRLRGAVDELRPASAEEVKTLRADLQQLAARVDALEAAARAKPAPPPPPPKPRRPAAKPAAKPAASAKPIASEDGAKPAASDADAATPAAKPAAAKARKRAPAKPKPTGDAT